MAINFPPITVTGQTYDYQGIRYTSDFTVAPGFWQVTTPGTFGVASSAEVDAGTDAVKFISPAALEGSKYNDVQASDVDYDDSASGIGTDVQSGMEVLALRPNPNLLINGGFDVWQRGETGDIETVAGDYFQCDRTSFKVLSGMQARNWKSSNTLPDGSIVNALRWTGYDNTTVLDQEFKIEIDAFDGLYGKEMTLSFDYRSNEVTTTPMSVNFNVVPNGLTTDGSINLGVFNAAAGNVTSRFSFTFTVPDKGATASTNNGYARLRFISSNPIASGKSTFMSRMKLELGSVETPYQARPIGEELALCKRYFHKSGDSSAGSIISWDYASGGGQDYGLSVFFPVEMRDEPAMTVTDFSSTNVSGSMVLRDIAKGHASYSWDCSASGATRVNFGVEADAEL